MFTSDYTIPLAIIATSATTFCLSLMQIHSLRQQHYIKKSSIIITGLGFLIGFGFLLYGISDMQKVDKHLESTKQVLEVKSIKGKTRSDYLTVETTQGTFKIDSDTKATITPGSKITVVKHEANPYYTVDEYEVK